MKQQQSAPDSVLYGTTQLNGYCLWKYNLAINVAGERMWELQLAKAENMQNYSQDSYSSEYAIDGKQGSKQAQHTAKME